jgi:hypothetical protein
MKSPLSIKRFKELRPSDLIACLVWQYVNNSYREPHDDRQRVRPLRDRLAIEYSPDLERSSERVGLIVAASLRLADGSEALGLFEPADRFSWSNPPTSVRNVKRDGQWLFYMKPYILTKEGPIQLWQWHREVTRQEMDRLYRLLGRNADEVFPIRLASRVPVDQVYFSKAVIPGFVAWVRRERVAV